MEHATFTPLTLTIIPKTASQVNNIIPTFDYKSNTPSFNGVVTVNELEQKRLKKAREHAARYEAKVRDYKKLGLLDSDRDKMRELLFLCQPHLRNMDLGVINFKIEQFIRSLP